MNTVKKVMKVIGLVLLVPVVLVVAALVYYQFDEPLNPKIVALLNSDISKAPTKDNAYYASVGMFIAAADDPYEAGLALHRNLAADSERQFGSIYFLSELEGVSAVTPSCEPSEICVPGEDANCIDDIKENIDRYARVVSQNRRFVKRFRALYDYEHFYEPIPYIEPTGIFLTHRLVLADIGLKWIKGNFAEARKLLGQDLQFWRRVSKDRTSLIRRIFAVALVSRDLHYLSALIDDCAQCLGATAQIERLLPPFSEAELSMRKTFEHEFVGFDLTMKSLAQEAPATGTSDWFQNLMYKPNSLYNKFYKHYENMIRYSECGFDRFEECERRYMTTLRSKPDYLSLDFIDDPIGEILVAIGAPAHHGYVSRIYALEPTRRLLIAKHIVMKRNPAPGSIAPLLGQLGTEYSNPFNGEPIQWDQSTRRIKYSAPQRADNGLTLEIKQGDH